MTDSVPQRIVRLDLRYDGTAYCGWQRQPDRPTIQGALERAVLALTGVASPVHGSGRTDAGVHALGQVAHFATSSRVPIADVARALNALLPRDIAVTRAVEAAPDFHARFAARRKTYVYQVYVAGCRDPLRDRYALRVARPPDVAAMRRAAAHLIGCHDFRAFATEGHLRSDTVRRLHGLRVLGVRDVVRVFATADGFLQHMVRTLAGLLLRVGDGRLPPQAAHEVLVSRDRRRAPATLPAHGLFLWRVDY